MRVGRSVVRESLRTIESSGLISIKPGSDGGIFVREPGSFPLRRSLSDLLRLGTMTVDELTEARLFIEKDVIELVMKKNNSEDYNRLDELIQSAFEKIEKGEKTSGENLSFHATLAEMCRNPIVGMVTKSLVSITSVFVRTLDPPFYHSRQILEIHRDILAKMKSGDVPGAKMKLEEDILYFNEEFKRIAPIKSIDFDSVIEELE
jgi:DNA-binding FadR family transcriptional regulator